MDSDFYDSFADYLKGGQVNGLVSYLDEDTNAAYAAVYRNGYRRTMRDALSANFPTVAAITGIDYFNHLADQFIEIHPPNNGTLIGYGHAFPELLRQAQVQHGLPYLHDLASLDAAWLAAYFAASGSPLTQDDLAPIISGEQDITCLRLGLAPHVSLVSLDYDTCDLWTLLKRQGTLVDALEIQHQESYGLVWRYDDLIHVRALESAEVEFLVAIEQGATLGNASQRGLVVDTHLDVTHLFSTLIRNQILQRS